MYPDIWRPSAPLPTHITVLYLVSVVGSAIADVLVYSTLNRSYEDVDFRDAPSKFGGSIPYFDGVEGFVVYANPANACQPIDASPITENYTGKWFVLISGDDECSYEDKIRAAQSAYFDLAIVHNVDSNVVEPMKVNDSEGIKIPSTFISEEAGIKIRDNYQYMYGYTIIIDDIRFPYGIFNPNLLIPFVIIVILCFCPILGYILVNFIKERRRAQRYRLPNSKLKDIPVEIFQKGSPYEICPICISDFVENEKLRILHCFHAFHTKCIDPWLTNYKKVCPICKRKVCFPGDSASNSSANSDSDSDSDTDDRSPLIRASATQTQGGTFNARDPPTGERTLAFEDVVANYFYTRRVFDAIDEIVASSSGVNHGTPEVPQPHPVSPTQLLAPMINSINSIESVGTIPAVIASSPSYSGAFSHISSPSSSSPPSTNSHSRGDC